MEAAIADLVSRFERGGLTRRQLIQGLALLAGGARAAAAEGFKPASINHVSIQVSDMKRSGEFYQRVLGLTALSWSDQSTLRLHSGKGHLSIREGKPGWIDHFCFGIEPFDEAAVTADLRARGAEPQKGGDAAFHVVDPDGVQIQLMGNDADHRIGG